MLTFIAVVYKSQNKLSQDVTVTQIHKLINWNVNIID